MFIHYFYIDSHLLRKLKKKVKFGGKTDWHNTTVLNLVKFIDEKKKLES